MKLPCCLVDEKGHKLVAQRHHATEAAAAARRGGSSSFASGGRNRSRNSVLGLALLLTSVFTDLCPMQPTNAVSKSITPPCRHSALQQFASFLEMEENAEQREDEDAYHFRRWDDPSALYTTQPGIHHRRTLSTRSQRRVGLVKTLETTGSFFRPALAPPAFHSTVEPNYRTSPSAQSSLNGESVDPSSSSSSSSSSSAGDRIESSPPLFATDKSVLRKSTVLHSNRVSSGVSPKTQVAASHFVGGGLRSSAEAVTHNDASTQATLWHQRDVLDLAVETGNTAFVGLTQQMISRGLFRTVYVCYLDAIASCGTANRTAEAVSNCVRTATTSHRSIGWAGDTGSYDGDPEQFRFDSGPTWMCTFCGKRHRQVREACVQCGAPSANVTKLFVGQLRKEALCDDALWKLVVAASPGVVPLRVEGHRWSSRNGGTPLPHPSTTDRGKGCGSVYVRPEDAARLVPLLHRNVFMDADLADPSREMFFFAYAEQQAWLEQFAQARVQSWGCCRPRTLPQHLVVCESAAH